MEKNYVTMATELEKLRAELNNSANLDRRTGIYILEVMSFISQQFCLLTIVVIVDSHITFAVGAYGGTTGYNENDATGHYPVGPNAYDDGYGVPQVCKLIGLICVLFGYAIYIYGFEWT